MQKMNQMEIQAPARDAEILALRKELQAVKQKEKKQGICFTEMNYEDGRKQEKNVDPRKYYMDKMRLWVQAYAPCKRS